MTVQAWLNHAAKQLSAASIGTARLDCLVLLEDCLNKDRTQILAHDDLLITAEHLEWLDARIKRRARHEPLAYIRGKTEFYGREFFVDNRVLEPRPESETMIDLLKNLLNNKSSFSEVRPLKNIIVDVGTGSGALAITAKREIPEADVVGIDVDPNCLDVATRNAKAYRADVALMQGDLLGPIIASRIQNSKPFTLILLCNLPYVPDDFHINPAAEAEPRIAIFGGKDGLDLYRQMFAQSAESNWKPNVIFAESLPPQHEKLAEIATSAGYKLTRTEDFIQQFEKY